MAITSLDMLLLNKLFIHIYMNHKPNGVNT